jgi:GTPase SAR1 family protein
LATDPQPAKKSYFFGKGYKDLWNTVKGAWQRNTESIDTYKDNIALSKGVDRRELFIFKWLLNSLAIIAVLICGSAITLVLSAINIAILLVFMTVIYIGFTVVWVTDRVYLLQKKIFTACHDCKRKSLIPTYICTNCGEKHTNLTPGVYGILKRTCHCGEILPTTFFNGRRELTAICHYCWLEGKITYLNDRETVPICIPIVGGRSVGKTAFITAFSKDFVESVAPGKSWEIEFYNEAKSNIYKEITRDYQTGSTRMTDRPQDVNKPSSISFSFFVKGDEFKPERLVHVYDIAGEVFTDNNENEVQKQYEYCQGIVFIIDPFSIPSVRHKCESDLTPEDIAGIGKADINGIVNSFLNKLREVTGLTDRKMLSVPLAVVINKADSAGLFNELGEAAVNNLMATNPEKYNNAMDVQDYLCRKFLIDNGMESFLNIINIKFKNNRFFVCSAIGHTRNKGTYQPKGVMEPMEWLFKNADSTMASNWKNTNFTKRPFALKSIEIQGYAREDKMQGD